MTLVLRGPRDARAPRARARRGWVPGVAALLCAVMGAVNVGSAVTPEIEARLLVLDPFVPSRVSHAATAATVLAGVLLLLLAHGLRRRKRRAWRGAVAVLAASVLLHLLKGLDVEEAGFAAAMLAGLVATRGEFFATGDPRTRRRAPAVLGVLVASDIGAGLAILHLRAAHLEGPHPLWRQVQFVAEGLAGVWGPLTVSDPATAALVGDVLPVLGVLTLVVTLYLALRPEEPGARLAEEDESRLRELLARHGGRDSLGYFALRRDKSVVWSPSGKAGICYRVVSGVLLASGDPVGDPEAWPGAITAFLRLAAEHAWVPAVIGCGERAGHVWARHGLSVLELGDEAVVEVGGFSLDGRAMRNVRQAVRGAERAGYRAEVRRMRDVPEVERAELRRLARQWRGGATERGFSMALGRLGDDADGDCLVVVATQDGGVPRGLLHFVPWGADGASLDLMLRDPRADNGLNEFLIVSMLRAAAGFGVQRVSLNFAVFRSALAGGERLGAGPLLRAWRSALLVASRWWQIESLYRFNAKFGPGWEPRFICYPGARDVPRIAVAALEAEAFIVWPRRPQLPRRPRRAAAVG